MVKVSVIVPVYNAKKYLQRSIRSLMEQTLSDVEFIIIDDGSQDGSAITIREIVNCYPARTAQVNLIERENRGVAATRAQGVDLATGEYIIHFDSDDWARLDMLELMYEKAKVEDADIVVCDYVMVFNNHQSVCHQQVSFSGIDCVKDLLTERVSNSNWNKLVRRDLYQKHQITFIRDLDMGEDFLVSLKLFHRAKKVAHISDCLYFYNKFNDNAVTHTYSEKSLSDLHHVTQLAEEYLLNSGIFSQVESEIIEFKINIKSLFVLHSNGELKTIIKGLELFPDTDRYIIKKCKSKLYVLISIMSKYNLLFLVPIVFFLRKHKI